jgi:acetyltransferase-like isoleucine patch superfamily enzyme
MTPLAELVIPHDVVSDETVLIVALSSQDSKFIEAGQDVLEYETSKAVSVIVAPVSGFIAYATSLNSSAEVGGTVAAIFSEWENEAIEIWRRSVSNTVKLPKEPSPLEGSKSIVQYSERAEKLIVEHRIDKSAFLGKDFVSVGDVERLLGVMANSPTAQSSKPMLDGVERIVIIGANKIAAEMLADTIGYDETKSVVGYVVDRQYRIESGLEYLDSEIFDFPSTFSRGLYDTVILAMGGSLKSMRFRKRVYEEYLAKGVKFTNLISKSATIASGVEIGVGNIIEANVYIGPHTVIGDNNFISYSTAIGHHSNVGSHNLFAPGINMAGLVKIGDECIFPTGVNFIDKINVGNGVIVPVGYDVISDLADGTVIKMRTSE